jgi:Uncharacterised nucleotidyltransferase
LNQSIIHALFDERVPLLNEIQDYEDCLNNEDFLAVGATVYSLLKKQKRLQHTPDFFQRKLQKIHTDTLFRNIFIKSQTHHILNEFEKQGIEVIPLKGPLFTERYFGDLGARLSSDIDLLIRKEDLTRATNCIKNLGFLHEKNEVSSHFNSGFYKELPESPCPLAVELHWNLVDENTSSINIEVFWDNAQRYQSTYHYVKELSDYHAFYMICLHGWRHNLDALKYYLDIMQMVNLLTLSLDFKRLIKDGEKYQTKRRLIRTLSIVYKQYPFLTDIKYFPYQKQHKVKTCQTTEKKSLSQYINFLDYQFLSYDSITHRLRELKLWFLPTPDEISMLLGDKKNSFLILDYFTLYKRRFTNLWKALW